MQSDLQAQCERQPLLPHVHFEAPTLPVKRQQQQLPAHRNNQHNQQHANSIMLSNHLDHTTSDSTSLLAASTSSDSPDSLTKPLSTDSVKAAPALVGAAAGPAALAPYYFRHWICFFLLGLINNIHFVFVLSSAYSLAVSFDALNLIGVISWATVILGMATKIINTAYLLNTSAYLRLLWSTVWAVIGLVMLVFSTRTSFALAIAAICIVGAFSAINESVILAHLRHFSPTLTGAWSAGTGWSGVFGTLGYLLMFSVLDWSNELIYALCVPTLIVYVAAFHYVHVTSDGHIRASEALAATTRQHALTDAGLLPSAAQPASSWTARYSTMWRVFKQVQSPALHLMLVYFLEYVCIVGYASASNPRRSAADIASSDDWWYDNAYEILSLCYQIGVLISRSSISFIQIRRIEWLSILQTVNFFVWLAQAYWHFLPLWAQFLLMVWVGLMGGGMYVNVFYILTRSDGGGVAVAKEDRELAINLVATGYYVGIIGSSLFEIVLAHTLLG